MCFWLSCFQVEGLIKVKHPLHTINRTHIHLLNIALHLRHPQTGRVLMTINYIVIKQIRIKTGLKQVAAITTEVRVKVKSQIEVGVAQEVKVVVEVEVGVDIAIRVKETVKPNKVRTVKVPLLPKIKSFSQIQVLTNCLY